MTHPDDIAKWFGDKWTANGTLVAVVPGGITNGPVSESAPAGPYASFAVSLGTAEYTSGPTYFTPFTVTVRVWADQNTGVDVSAVARLVGATFPKVPPTALRDGGYVISLTPDDAAATVEPVIRNANDVVLFRKAWRGTAVGYTDQP